MIRIVSDTSTMYSTAQAEAAGFHVSPLSVTIAGKNYREFDEISAEEFVAIIRQGHMPTSSQPAIGEVEALYQRFAGTRSSTSPWLPVCPAPTPPPWLPPRCATTAMTSP